MTVIKFYFDRSPSPAEKPRPADPKRLGESSDGKRKRSGSCIKAAIAPRRAQKPAVYASAMLSPRERQVLEGILAGRSRIFLSVRLPDSKKLISVNSMFFVRC
jgi:hypothetical protein